MKEFEVCDRISIQNKCRPFWETKKQQTLFCLLSFVVHLQALGFALGSTNTTKLNLQKSRKI